MGYKSNISVFINLWVINITLNRVIYGDICGDICGDIDEDICRDTGEDIDGEILVEIQMEIQIYNTIFRGYQEMAIIDIAIGDMEGDLQDIQLYKGEKVEKASKPASVISASKTSRSVECLDQVSKVDES